MLVTCEPWNLSTLFCILLQVQSAVPLLGLCDIPGLQGVTFNKNRSCRNGEIYSWAIPIHHPIPIAISMRMLAALQICAASLSPSSKLTSSSTTICHELRALVVLTTAEPLCGTDEAYCLSQSSHPVCHTWNTQPSKYLKVIYMLM